MSDINLLSSADDERDKKDANVGKKASNEDLTLHVPVSELPKPAVAPVGGDFLAKLIDQEKAATAPPASILSQKIAPIPSVPKAAVPAQKPTPPPLVVPPMSKPAPKPPSIPTVPPVPPPPPAPEEKGSGTLRVSLITSNGGAGFSDVVMRRRLRTFATIGVVGIAVNGLIFGGLHLQKAAVEKRNAAAQQEVANVDAKIAEREAKLGAVRDFQALSRIAARVLDNHTHWTQVLKLLEERALPDVQFGSLAGADSGTLGFEVTARDYTTLAKQIVAFRQDPRVLKATIGTASADVGEGNLLKGVRASMALMIDPNVFKFDQTSVLSASSTTQF